MPAKDLKSVAIAAVAAAALMALMALAAPAFADQRRQPATCVEFASVSPVARIDFNSDNSPNCNRRGGGGVIGPLTGGLLLVVGGYGVWTTRPLRPKVAAEFDAATA
jgi:hypothetical protein